MAIYICPFKIIILYYLVSSIIMLVLYYVCSQPFSYLTRFVLRRHCVVFILKLLFERTNDWQMIKASSMAICACEAESVRLKGPS